MAYHNKFWFFNKRMKIGSSVRSHPGVRKSPRLTVRLTSSDQSRVRVRSEKQNHSWDLRCYDESFVAMTRASLLWQLETMAWGTGLQTNKCCGGTLIVHEWASERAIPFLLFSCWRICVSDSLWEGMIWRVKRLHTTCKFISNLL